MKPIRFSESNAVYAKNQPQYEPLPVLVQDDGIYRNNCVTSLWKPTIKERIQILFGKNIYHHQIVYGGALQPVKLTLEIKP